MLNEVRPKKKNLAVSFFIIFCVALVPFSACLAMTVSEFYNKIPDHLHSIAKVKLVDNEILRIKNSDMSNSKEKAGCLKDYFYSEEGANDIARELIFLRSHRPEAIVEAVIARLGNDRCMTLKKGR